MRLGQSRESDVSRSRPARELIFLLLALPKRDLKNVKKAMFEGSPRPENAFSAFCVEQNFDLGEVEKDVFHGVA
jgi:hypothetical protein